jgi:hypothetical protein
MLVSAIAEAEPTTFIDRGGAMKVTIEYCGR